MARLRSGGVSVPVPTGGTLEDGTQWDSPECLAPGDDGHEEVSAAARARVVRSGTSRPGSPDADITAFVASLNRYVVADTR